MRKRKTWFIIIISLAAVGIALGAYFSHSVGKTASSEDGPPGTRVERRDIQFSIEVTGDVTPVLQVEIKPEVSARIIHLPFIAGQTVKRAMSSSNSTTAT